MVPVLCVRVGVRVAVSVRCTESSTTYGNTGLTMATMADSRDQLLQQQVAPGLRPVKHKLRKHLGHGTQSVGYGYYMYNIPGHQENKLGVEKNETSNNAILVGSQPGCHSYAC